MHSTYEVHFGTPAPDDGTVFAPDVSAAIQSDGIPFGMGQHDFEHNGRVDMMFTIIDPDIFKAIVMLIDAFLTHSVSLDLEFYRMKGGIYPDKPSATRKIRADVAGEAGEKTFFPAVLIGDERRQPLGPAGGEEPERAARLSRRAGAGPVRPTASEGGGRHARRRGIHLAGGPRRGPPLVTVGRPSCVVAGSRARSALGHARTAIPVS
jgi:hypothetical protein